ncbi:hypothetical protein Osc7112_1548 [Oscillatoria nigro-viridis PCC 7112]|uniref:Uncharacterized protein n=1 Tax=Phormidium nigroviride PCC 7112 TaxID=179408 RepID=K9VDT6_9CYAN|nr:hypothetical protein Osc7112_1548 [Oscillatoria nigro-viridis PCC 7112]
MLTYVNTTTAIDGESIAQEYRPSSDQFQLA